VCLVCDLFDYFFSKFKEFVSLRVVKISKALVLPHVKRLENEMVRMLLVVVSLVCQLRELVSIV
jgi:hypothetical protein